MTRTVTALLAVVLLAASCGVREVRCREYKLSDGTPCLRCYQHNTLGNNDTDPSVDCSEKDR